MCTLKHHHTIQPQLFNPIKTEKAHTKNLLSFVRGTKCKMETCQRAFVSQDLWIEKCECGWEKLQLPRPPPSILSFQAAYLKYTICPVWSLHFSYLFPSILAQFKNVFANFTTSLRRLNTCPDCWQKRHCPAHLYPSPRSAARKCGGAGSAAANNLLYRKMKITWHESVFCLLVSRHGCQPGQSSSTVPDQQSQTHQQVLRLLHTNIITLNH